MKLRMYKTIDSYSPDVCLVMTMFEFKTLKNDILNTCLDCHNKVCRFCMLNEIKEVRIS